MSKKLKDKIKEFDKSEKKRVKVKFNKKFKNVFELGYFLMQFHKSFHLFCLALYDEEQLSSMQNNFDKATQGVSEFLEIESFEEGSLVLYFTVQSLAKLFIKYYVKKYPDKVESDGQLTEINEVPDEELLREIIREAVLDGLIPYEIQLSGDIIRKIVQKMNLSRKYLDENEEQNLGDMQ